MRNIMQLPQGSLVAGALPVSCSMCQEGSKMVLLVTGLCSFKCYYCPLSLEKQGKKVTYANERMVETDEDVLEEARSIDAEGTGITGGDPLLEMELTVRYIHLLKDEFGQGHDIHLYTSTPDIDKIKALADAGLDEIRFHPPLEVWDVFERTDHAKAIQTSLELGLRTGIEIPAIPGTLENIIELAKSLDRLGSHFLNLNELEYSESNWQELNERGFTVKDDISSAVKGSEETAIDVINALDLKLTVHYCSSSFKDATQLRNRIMRRARNVATPLDIITDDGTLIKGIIHAQEPEQLITWLKKEFEVPQDLIRMNTNKDRIEIAAWILEEIHTEIESQCFIIEQYPTADELEVERRPLT